MIGLLKGFNSTSPLASPPFYMRSPPLRGCAAETLQSLPYTRSYDQLDFTTLFKHPKTLPYPRLAISMQKLYHYRSSTYARLPSHFQISVFNIDKETRFRLHHLYTSWPLFQYRKLSDIYPLSQIKLPALNHTFYSGTYLYSLHVEVTPPDPLYDPVTWYRTVNTGPKLNRGISINDSQARLLHHVTGSCQRFIFIQGSA